MPKINLSDITDIRSPSAINTLAANNTLIENAIENTLSRDGTSPNQMGADLDMNSFRILNLPAPTVGGDPVRQSDLEQALETFEVELTDKLTDEGTFVKLDQYYTKSEVNNLIADIDASDAATLAGQLPSYYLNRANHTGTQTASTISDFDVEVSNNTDVAANTAARHTHSNLSVLNATTASFTTADETKLDGIETNADVTDSANVAAAINSTVNKTTPVNADNLALIDSETSNSLKKLSWSDAKSNLESYFNTQYANITHIHNISDVTNLQTTLDNKQPLNSKLTDLSNITFQQGDILYYNGTNLVKLSPGTNGQFLKTQGASANPVWSSAGDVTGPALSTNGDVAVFSGTTGKVIADGGKALPSGSIVGTTDTQTLTNKTINGSSNTLSNVSLTSAVTGTLPIANGGTNATTASGARTNLGLAIGTDVQAYNARLADIAGISFAQGDILYYNGTNLVKLAAGTNGQFLKTQGVGANPMWDTPTGAGDVTGPASSTNGNVAIFNGTTGKIIADGGKALPTGTVVGTTDTQTLTNKTINLSSNTLTGTTAQFNSALSDNDFATLSGTETLSNKTLSSPSISGETLVTAVGDALVARAGSSPRGGLYITGTSNRLGVGDNLTHTTGNNFNIDFTGDWWLSGNPGGSGGYAYAIFTGTGTAGNDSNWSSNTRLSITSSGAINIPGSLTLGGLLTSNGQISFPATPNPSSDVHTLDDYEEGTWTPNITFGGGSTGVTYSAQNRGAYIKIGRLVLLQGLLELSNKGTSTGAAVITNLPFTNGTNDNTGLIGWYSGMSGISGPVTLLWNASPSGPNIYQGGATASSALTDANFTNTSRIWFTLSYIANS